MRTEGLLGDLLQPDVERELEIVAGGRRRAGQRAHGAAARVDLHLLDAGGAVQLAFVGQLDADLADVVGALVVGGLLPLLDPLDVAVVDAADVADHVRGDFAERILAEQPCLDLDAREPVAVDGKARDLVVGEPGAQRQAFEIPRLLEQLLESLAVARLDVDDLRERVDGFVEVPDARGLDFERVGGVALRQDNAIAVGDHAAVGHDRHDRDAVGLGQRLVVAVLHHLQVDEAAEQRRERDHDQRAGDPQTTLEQEQLALGVAQLGRVEAASRAIGAPPRREGKAPHHRRTVKGPTGT